MSFGLNFQDKYQRIRGLCKLPDERDWLWGKLGLALVGRVLLSKL